MAKSMKYLSIIVLFCAFFVGTVVHSTAHAKSEKTAEVGASTLNIRTMPNHSANVIGSVKKGTRVQVTNEKYGWAKIHSGNVEGWVASQYLMSENGMNSGVINANSLRLREQPATNSSVIKTLSKGTQVTIFSEKYGWLNVETEQGSKGWVSQTFVSTTSHAKGNTSADHTSNGAQNVKQSSGEQVTLLYNGINLRNGPGTDNKIVGYGHEGQQFIAIETRNDWTHIQLPGQGDAWVASWLLAKKSSSNHTNSNASRSSRTTSSETHSGLKGKTIVVDAGHGGYDNGTTGARGTLEKGETLSTASFLASKLEAAGANVIMTRQSDQYISLPHRVSVSQANNADAFISVHYNAAQMNTSGIMTFYYSPEKEKAMARSVQRNLIEQTGLADDGVRFGDYYVLRQNSQPAILVELGFLSNASEEAVVTTPGFQKHAADGILLGLTQYFE